MSVSSHPLLGRRPLRTAPAVPVIADHPGLSLALGRLHEGCGSARRSFALWVAAQMQGPVLWVAPDWERDRLNAEGVLRWVDPARLIFVNALRAEDVLWTLEEALRAGAVPLVVGDLTGLPGLTQVRRMHLAAETGGIQGPHVPLGLILTPGQGGAQGVESRWHLAPDHARHPSQWHLTRLRARTAPPATWTISAQHRKLVPRAA